MGVLKSVAKFINPFETKVDNNIVHNIMKGSAKAVTDVTIGGVTRTAKEFVGMNPDHDPNTDKAEKEAKNYTKFNVDKIKQNFKIDDEAKIQQLRQKLFDIVQKDDKDIVEKMKQEKQALEQQELEENRRKMQQAQEPASAPVAQGKTKGRIGMARPKAVVSVETKQKKG